MQKRVFLIFSCLLTWSLHAPSYATVTVRGAGPEAAQSLVSSWVSGFKPVPPAMEGKKKAVSVPSVDIQYQGVKGMEELKLIKAHVVDFALTALPMPDDEMKKLNGVIYHIPVAAKGVSVIYNFPDSKEPLHLSGEVLTQIYTGVYKKWNHPMIKKNNKKLKLPNEFIMPAYRSDANSSQYIFTEFLSHSSKAWAKDLGFGPTIAWKAGKGVEGHQAMIDYIKATPYSLGFADYAAAVSSGLAMASVTHAEGVKPVSPTLETMGKALDKTVENFPSDNRITLTQLKAEGAYPLTAYVYILIYQTQADPAKAKALVEFIRYVLNDGQSGLFAHYLAPLPARVKEKALQTLTQIYLPLQ